MPSIPPPAKTPMAATLKGIAGLVIALAGLTTAIAAIVRRPTEDAAKAGYVELTTALIETQSVGRKNHEDIVALRGFLEEYVKGHESVITSVPSARAPSEAPTVFLIPPPGSSSTSVVRASSPPSASPPPPVSPLPAPKPVRNVDSIAW